VRLGERLMRAPATAPGAAALAARTAEALAGTAVAKPPGRRRELTRLPRRTPERQQVRPSLRSVSFVVLVLVPTAFAAVYYFAIAADQYVAEFRFTLSTADPPRLDSLSLLSGAAGQSQSAQEAQVLVQYISSRAIIDDIGPAADLRRLFQAPQADWWARLEQRPSIEELARYWRGQVDPFYDTANGAVTVRVRAFAPEDALRLAQAVVAACEKLVNELSLRARQDALRLATSEVSQAEARLKSVLDQIRDFRDREGLIDPARTAEATGALATRLRGDLIKANAELSTLKSYMKDDAPVVKVVKARIRSLEAQRQALASEMTDPDKARSDTLSRALGSYEQLESERKFAEAAYQHALASLDQARAIADRQRVFLASFIPPSLPEEALYPRRWHSLGIVALIAFAVWGIGGLAVQSIRDHVV